MMITSHPDLIGCVLLCVFFGAALYFRKVNDSTVNVCKWQMASAWESPVFTGLLSRMVSTFTPARLRIECESKRLITRTQRQNFAALVGPAAQNEALLDALRSGDDESFHVFLECIRDVEPEASVREILAKLDGVDKLRTAGGARAAEAPGMLAAGATLDRPTGECAIIILAYLRIHSLPNT